MLVMLAVFADRIVILVQFPTCSTQLVKEDEVVELQTQFLDPKLSRHRKKKEAMNNNCKSMKRLAQEQRVQDMNLGKRATDLLHAASDLLCGCG